MFVIQEKIGDGLKTGALSLDQSQNFLTKLKAIRAEYNALKDKNVYRDEWDSLIGRIDALGDEINRSLVRTTGIEEPTHADRTITRGRDGAIVYSATPVDYSRYGRPPIPAKILLLIPAEFESFDYVGNYDRGSIRYPLGREAEQEMRHAFGIEFAKVEVWPVRSEARAREMLLLNDPENARVRGYDYVAIPKFLRADSLERKEKYEFEIDLQVEFNAINGSSITFNGHGTSVIRDYAQTTPEKDASLTLQYAVSALLDGIEKSRDFFVK